MVVQAQISAAMEGIEQHNVATNTKLDEITEQLKGITAWMQTMEAATRTLTTSASLLQLHAEDASTRLTTLESPMPRPTPPPDLATSSTAPSTVEVRTVGTDRPHGHGGQHQPRGPVLGGPASPDLPPAHGTFSHARPVFESEAVHGDRRVAHAPIRSPFGSTPKMDFPKFDGEDYQVWIDNCELYFDIYGVSETMKVKFAALNVVGNAALWLKMA